MLGALPPPVMAGLLESALRDTMSCASWPAESKQASDFLMLCSEAVRYNTIPRDKIRLSLMKFIEEENRNAANL